MAPDAAATFGRSLVEAVAEDRSMDPDDLFALIDAHQDAIATSPGVGNLLYEWRKQFDATLLERTADAYYVAAPEWIWGDFANHLDADEDDVDALAAVHRRTVLAHEGVQAEALNNATCCVLLRS